MTTSTLDHDAPAPAIEWTGALDLARVEQPVTAVGAGALVDDPVDAAMLRAARDAHAARDDASWYYQYLPMTDEGVFFRVHARDTVPFEDERGLVVLPE
ncbi:hypothetical protein [Sandaracinus amylolyticus]|uniref:hypothetical protein n=1 Tax=Sandaracinus amylolyticus TaxID=927083 RepID=UPI0012EDA37C|nr:hypothetical protein [Sandaracinus amylolyticus]